MENQVQLLEDLLSRVQRNRLRLVQESTMDTSALSSVASTTNEDVQDASSRTEDEAVIDLVNPTSRAPRSPFDDIPESDTNSDLAATTTAASNLLDEKMASEPVAAEDDFSSVAPVSIIPEPMEAGVADSSTTGLPEDDFSAVAPVSIVPPPAVDEPLADVQRDMALEVPPSMLPAAEPTVSSGFSDDTSAYDVEDSSAEAEEFELVDTDVATAQSHYPSNIAEAISADAVGSQAAQRTSVVHEEKIETRTFEEKAIASKEVVELKHALPVPKDWTVGAVLHRAWCLGK